MALDTAGAFATRLVQLRQTAGLTQQTLATRAGVGLRTLRDLEHGATLPRQSTLLQLANAFSLAPAERQHFLAAAQRKPDERDGGSIVGLPRPLTRLIGREQEVCALARLIQDDHLRLVTVTGPAGIGKTRLAISVAEVLANEMPDGVVFVSLAHIQDWHQIPAALAQTLQVQEDTTHSVWEGITSMLAGTKTLIVLDNFEHLLDGTAFVVNLLADCPQVIVLVTSRIALRVRGEQRFPVPPLCSAPLAEAPQRLSDAGALFLERAHEVDPLLPLTPANQACITTICQRLDGIPLAIELAAMRVTTFPPPILLRHLEQGLAVLDACPRDLPPRQQTMRDAIAWSYDLLSPPVQYVFRRLSVFIGGWTLSAAQVVGEREISMEDLVFAHTELMDAQLIHRLPTDEKEEPRYAMLETLRVYGREQLASHAEEVVAQQSHAAFLLMLAQQAEDQMRGSHRGQWLCRLDQEQGNLYASMQWASSHQAAGGDVPRLRSRRK